MSILLNSDELMAASKTGPVRGRTIELEGPVPELEGMRVRVVIEAMEEPQVAAARQRELWEAWASRGPQGPIES